MKFTPGKWIADRHICGDGWRVFVQHTAENDQHDAICDIETWQSDEQTKANAFLIAASKKLLACCKLALPLLQEYRERVIKGEITGHLLTADYEATRDMEAAIAAAERGE